MARIYTEHAAWGNNNGLSGLNGFTCCVIIEFCGRCRFYYDGALETSAPPNRCLTSVVNCGI